MKDASPPVTRSDRLNKITYTMNETKNKIEQKPANSNTKN